MNAALPLRPLAAQPLPPSARGGLMLQRKCACGASTASLTGKCDECNRGKRLQAKRTAGASAQANPVPASVDRVLASPGRPLDQALQQDMGQRFNHDFSGVRVHADGAAAHSAREVNAHAYTVGSHIVFGAGEYSPQASAGRQLLAHELAHVVQSAGAGAGLSTASIDGGPGDPLEREADQAARDLMAGRAPQVGGTTTGARMYRQPIVDEPAAGCGTCLPATLVGSLVHDLVQAAFPPTYQNEARFTIPASGGDAILDLLHVTLSPGSPPSTVEVGEIKPNNVEGIKDGAKDLLFYMSELRLRFPAPFWEVVPMTLPPPVIAMPFRDGVSPFCPTQAVSVIPAGGLYLYSCAPPRSTIPSACCYPPPVPVKKPETKDAKDKKTADKKVDEPVTPPLGAPIPAAARDTALFFTILVAGGLLIAKFGGKRLTAPLAAMAAIILLANGAEAKIGLEGDDPLKTLFDQSAAKGQPIPEDIKEALRNDSEMRKLLTDAAKSGNYSEAQRQAGEAVTRAILANRDAFTQEELEILLSATEGNKGTLPAAEVTVEALKKQIELRKKGVGGPGAGGGTGGAAKPIDNKETADGGKAPTGAPVPLPPAVAPPERLVAGLEQESTGGPKFSAKVKERLLAVARAVKPPLTDAEVTRLLGKVGSAKGMTEDQVVASVERGIAEVRKASNTGQGAPGGVGGKADAQAPNTLSKLEVDKADPGKKAPAAQKDIIAAYDKALARYEWIAPDQSFLALPDPPYLAGQTYTVFLIGRDKEGQLYVGPVQVTVVSKGDSTWKIKIAAGSTLYTKGRLYGSTRALETDFTPPELAKGDGKKK
jgi:hypothetical protein